MRRVPALFFPVVLLLGPLVVSASEAILPAGTLLQCTVSEPNFSSKTAEIGDPVLCHASPVESFGRSVLPYGTYMIGRFAEYKDPGHFVGKGWMELNFDRMVIPPGQIVPLSAKVVYVKGMPVDKMGRIHGKGHAVRDAVEWAIPVLWPIDVLTLPERGPRPKLKPETRLTLKVMDDVAVTADPLPPRTLLPRSSLQTDQFGFATRPPIEAIPGIGFTSPAALAVTPSVSKPASNPEVTVLMLKDGNGRLARDYWFERGGQIRFTSMDGTSIVLPIESLDLAGTVEVNRKRGVAFVIRSDAPSGGTE